MRLPRWCAPAVAALVLMGCNSAPAEKVTPDLPARELQAGPVPPEYQGCYQTSWWAETSAVIYRRFDEEHRPQPAQADNQPAAATEECP